jgi:probable F420-dependent oxidoreductase
MTDIERGTLGKLGVWRRGAAEPRFAAEVEQLGYDAIWWGGSPAADLALPEALLDATSTITVGTSIVNIWREPAERVAQSYHRIAAKHPGRFLLGVGVGHPEHDQRFAKPYDALVGYLDVLAEHGVPSDRTLLAALGPKVLGLAARRTAGSLPYLVTPRHTRQARELVGADSLIIPEQKLVFDADRDHARQVARAELTRYFRLQNYVSNLRRLGFTDEDFAQGGSDRLVDELAAHGDVGTLAAAVTAHLDTGADQVAVRMLGDDPLPGLRALAKEFDL